MNKWKIKHLQLKGLWCTRAHFGGMLWLMRKITITLPILSSFQSWVDRKMDRYSNRKTKKFDEYYGTDTFQRHNLKELNIAAKLDWSWLYGPINPDFFHEIIKQLKIDKEKYIFVDIGAGKGMAMLLASNYKFKQLIAIEFAEDLVNIGKKNVELFSKKENRSIQVDWVCEDFMKYQLPDKQMVIFLNNPFPETISKRVIEHIQSWLSKNKREMIIIYRKPSTSVLTLLDNMPQLKIISWSPYWRAYSRTN